MNDALTWREIGARLWLLLRVELRPWRRRWRQWRARKRLARKVEQARLQWTVEPGAVIRLPAKPQFMPAYYELLRPQRYPPELLTLMQNQQRDAAQQWTALEAMRAQQAWGVADDALRAQWQGPRSSTGLGVLGGVLSGLGRGLM